MIKHLHGKKIFFAVSANTVVTNQWQYLHFIDELQRHGIGFEIHNCYDYPATEHEQVLLETIKSKREQIGLFFTGYPDEHISVPTLREIRKLGIPTVLICYDNLSVPHIHRKTSAEYDLVWLTSHETESLFRTWGAKTIVLPYAANPYVYLPRQASEILAVGFVGSLYGARGYRIKFLSDHQIDTRVYTNRQSLSPPSSTSAQQQIRALASAIMEKSFLTTFPEGRRLLRGDIAKALRKRAEHAISFGDSIRFYDQVSVEEMARLYSQFALSLGITEVWNTYLLPHPLYKLHLRTFEIPMCGGLQLTHRTPELEAYFEDEKEIILYDSDEEMIDKVRFYLQETQVNARFAMKHAAHVRALNEHTWMNRFEKIFLHLGL
jgi:spore maturation protein CgeB